VRWLLRKDLAILARSRVLLALLIVYPVAIALLLGFAISRSPARPRVAIVNETVPGETIKLGAEHIPVASYVRGLFDEVQAVYVGTRAQAVAKVDSGAVLAAVVLPAGLAAQLASSTNQAQLEVLYNGNALEQSIARSTIESELARANLNFSEQIQTTARKVIHTLLAEGRLPGLAAEDLSLASRVLATIGQPIRVQSVLIHGRHTPLDTFAVVVAVSLSMMLLCVLLAAGGVALEREEHTLARLLRGRARRGEGRALVSTEGLLAEKTLLAAGVAFVVAFAMLAGIGAFVTLEFSRIGMWLLALALGALALSALGVAIGALAHELRAASLLALLTALPLAFLALVPSGAVSAGLGKVIDVVSFAFPFKAALQALDTAVNGAAPSLTPSLLHLALLICVFALLARVGLRAAE
jgi:ABC-2 type transport system permease protein